MNSTIEELEKELSKEMNKSIILMNVALSLGADLPVEPVFPSEEDLEEQAEKEKLDRQYHTQVVLNDSVNIDELINQLENQTDFAEDTKVSLEGVDLDSTSRSSVSQLFERVITKNASKQDSSKLGALWESAKEKVKGLKNSMFSYMFEKQEARIQEIKDRIAELKAEAQQDHSESVMGDN